MDSGIWQKKLNDDFASGYADLPANGRVAFIGKAGDVFEIRLR